MLAGCLAAWSLAAGSALSQQLPHTSYPIFGPRPTPPVTHGRRCSRNRNGLPQPSDDSGRGSCVERLLRYGEYSTKEQEAPWLTENSFSVTVGSSPLSLPIISDPNFRSRDLVINRYTQGHTYVHTIICELSYKDENGRNTPQVLFTLIAFP